LLLIACWIVRNGRAWTGRTRRIGGRTRRILTNRGTLGLDVVAARFHLSSRYDLIPSDHFLFGNDIIGIFNLISGHQLHRLDDLTGRLASHIAAGRLTGRLAAIRLFTSTAARATT
jgi:hypothetical protein